MLVVEREESDGFSAGFSAGLSAGLSDGDGEDAADDVADDGGGIASPSIREVMVAARRRRQGTNARAAPFVTDPYMEQRRLVSHAEGVVVLSQARQQLAQAV